MYLLEQSSPSNTAVICYQDVFGRMGKGRSLTISKNGVFGNEGILCGISRYTWCNADIIETLLDIMIMRGTVEYLRNNGGFCRTYTTNLSNYLNNSGANFL